MKVKWWKFWCQNHQWRENWGLRGGCRRAFGVPLNPLTEAPICPEARMVLPLRLVNQGTRIIGKTGASGDGLSRHRSRNSWILKRP